MKTVFLANWHTNVIKERELIDRQNGLVRIKPLVPGECEMVDSSNIVNCFETYDAALSWIKEKHVERIAKVKQELLKAEDKHKHPVKFYALLEFQPN